MEKATRKQENNPPMTEEVKCHKYICSICGTPHGERYDYIAKDCPFCQAHPEEDDDDYDHDALDLHTL